VVVNLYAFTGAFAGTASNRGGHAEFSNIPVGRYTLEVIAAGYQKLTQSLDVSMAGQHEQVDVTLTPEASTGAPSPSTDGPVLAPNAQKELSKALEALRANKLDEAKKHLDKLSHAAPANPDVNYLWGMYYLDRKDWRRCRNWRCKEGTHRGRSVILGALSKPLRLPGSSTSASRKPTSSIKNTTRPGNMRSAPSNWAKIAPWKRRSY
jgi:Carboxypeptidase regulatory-like domain